MATSKNAADKAAPKNESADEVEVVWDRGDESIVSDQLGDPIEQPSVTGRAADEAGPNSTFASRAGRSSKRVSEASNKAVSSAESK